MITSPFSLNIQVLWILQGIKETQPELLKFVKSFMECFPSSHPEHILFAGLAPHFREEGSMLMVTIPNSCIARVRNAHLISPKAWKMALRELKQKLQARNIHQSSIRTMTHEHLARNFFREDIPSAQRDKRHAEILFLAIWEMEALSLESQGKTITP